MAVQQVYEKRLIRIFWGRVVSKVCARLKIQGIVQGVFYRQSTKEAAERLGLTGWARNCPDGSVEAVFEGEREAVNAVIDWCRQGPPAARVTGVAVDWQEFQDLHPVFGIRY